MTYLAVGLSLAGLVVVHYADKEPKPTEPSRPVVRATPHLESAAVLGSPTPIPTPAAPVPSESRVGSRLAGSPILMLLGLAFLTMVMPIGVIYYSPISVVIYGVGIYNAWKMNAVSVPPMAGPFRVEPDPNRPLE